MKNTIAIAAILCAACTNPGTPVQVTGAVTESNFEVSRLFDTEGCAVYRFRDAGRYHYFTTCGEAISSQTETCGKGCTRQYSETIRTKEGVK